MSKKIVPTTPISKKGKAAASGKNSNNAPQTDILVVNDISLILPEFRDVSKAGETALMKPKAGIDDIAWDGSRGEKGCLDHVNRVSRMVARVNWSESETILALSLNLKGEVKNILDCLTVEDWSSYVKALGRKYLVNTSQTSLVKELLDAEQEIEETISGYFGRVRILWNHVDGLDGTVTEATAVKVWLSNLNSNWCKNNQGVLIQLRSCSTFSSIEDLLIKHADIIISDITRTRNRDDKRKPADKNTSNRKCWVCEKTGHVKRDCPEKKSKGNDNDHSTTARSNNNNNNNNNSPRSSGKGQPGNQ